MITLKSEVNCLFLHAWLKTHRFKVEQLKLKPVKQNSRSQKYEITDATVLFLLNQDYQSFITSNQTVEDFLDIDIITFRENSQGKYFTDKTEARDRPIVLLFSKKNSKDFLLRDIVKN